MTAPDFPVDELMAAFAARIWDFKEEFTPPLVGSDLDEFWGAAAEADEVPIPGVIVEPLGGSMSSVGGGVGSDDVHRLRISIFSDVPQAGAERRPKSLLLLRQLVKVLRREDFLESPHFNFEGGQIQEIDCSDYEPNNTFFSYNIAGWGLLVDVRVLCQARF